MAIDAGGHAAPSGELAALIREQEKDDGYMVSRPNEVSLDAPLPSGRTLSDLVALDEIGEIVDFTPRDPVPVGSGEHGTLAAYSKRSCRCIPCKAAWAAYYREYRARKRGAA